MMLADAGQRLRGWALTGVAVIAQFRATTRAMMGHREYEDSEGVNKDPFRVLCGSGRQKQ